MSTFKKAVKPIVRILFFIGINAKQVVSLRYIPRYIGEYFAFRRLGGRSNSPFPIMSDYNAFAGSAKGQYFHQDLLVANLIHEAAPKRHIDIGSRIDGFVAHVAAFRKIEVMDVRALTKSEHENIQFLQADLMDEDNAVENASDSVSCLHAIEHFGLGRYGDPLDPEGHIKGFHNIVRMVKPGGTLYMGFPIGRKTTTHFNAHRVFHPHDIFSWMEPNAKLELTRFDYVDDDGDLHTDIDLMSAMPDVGYGCGIYSFKKS